jgi:hypothetical protein
MWPKLRARAHRPCEEKGGFHSNLAPFSDVVTTAQTTDSTPSPFQASCQTHNPKLFSQSSTDMTDGEDMVFAGRADLSQGRPGIAKCISWLHGLQPHRIFEGSL